MVKKFIGDVLNSEVVQGDFRTLHASVVGAAGNEMEISRRGTLWQPWLNFENLRVPGKRREEIPKATSLRRKPSSAWRMARRRDPIQCEALDMSPARVHHHSRPSVIVPTAPQPGATTENTAVTPTASVTPSAATRGQRTGIRSPGIVSDPAIDEHFKRSLGLKNYAAVFSAANNDKEAGLSVDDHFAKALGETWTKLQETTRYKNTT